MKSPGKALTYLLVPLVLLSISVGIRIWFFSGFALCDDAEEFALFLHLNEHGPDFTGHLQYRFPMWIFNLVSIKLFGTSLWALFLPTVLMSAGLSVLAYLLLDRFGYSRGASFFGGLLVAAAPFEVLTGTLRANDVILEFFLALALTCLFLLESRPQHQGIALGLILWLAFYTKMWAVYLLPLVAVYYLWRMARCKEWKGAVLFALTSLLAHAGTMLFWKWKLGVFLPFIQAYSATYPVPPRDLGGLFLQYPYQLFVGSDLGNTLFGAVPYLALGLFLAKIAGYLSAPSKRLQWKPDRLDYALLSFYLTFLLLLNFVPNHYKFEHYYSAPRIFRYLAPLSFPLALHAAKLGLDFCRLLPASSYRLLVAPLMMCGMLALSLLQAAIASGPAREHWSAQKNVLAGLVMDCPPQLLIDAWQAFFFQQFLIRDQCPETYVRIIPEIQSAADYQGWLLQNQPELPEEAVLVSGLASCVHYGCAACGFRLSYFNAPLDPRWTKIKAVGRLSYLPQPEEVLLWRWKPAASAEEAASAGMAPLDPGLSYEQAFRLAMTEFDKGNYTQARRRYRWMLSSSVATPQVEDAQYFYAVSYWREADYLKTIKEFQQLIERYPLSHWVPGAHYHIGLAYKELKRPDKARAELEIAAGYGSLDPSVAALARERLNELPRSPLFQRVIDLFREWHRS